MRFFANFKVLFRHLPGGTEENYKNEPDLTVSQPKLESSEYKSGVGQAVVQLVEALRHNPEGRGFESQWCHWNFSLT
jgi:hypothetical protein